MTYFFIGLHAFLIKRLVIQHRFPFRESALRALLQVFRHDLPAAWRHKHRNASLSQNQILQQFLNRLLLNIHHDHGFIILGLNLIGHDIPLVGQFHMGIQHMMPVRPNISPAASALLADFLLVFREKTIGGIGVGGGDQSQLLRRNNMYIADKVIS